MSIIILHQNWMTLLLIKYKCQIKLFSDYVEPVHRMTKTQKGAPVMIDSRDYMYTIERVAKISGKTHWRCRSKNALGCNARATTLNDYIIRFYNEHKHSPPQNKTDVF